MVETPDTALPPVLQGMPRSYAASVVSCSLLCCLSWEDPLGSEDTLDTTPPPFSSLGQTLRRSADSGSPAFRSPGIPGKGKSRI